jgi:hypothetical protein
VAERDEPLARLDLDTKVLPKAHRHLRPARRAERDFRRASDDGLRVPLAPRLAARAAVDARQNVEHVLDARIHLDAQPLRRDRQNYAERDTKTAQPKHRRHKHRHAENAITE